MIYICLGKGCHFIFGDIHPAYQCPDCGKQRLRPADRAERAEYLRRQTMHLPQKSKSG